MSDIKALIADINKKYGANTLGFAKDLGYTSTPRLSSGSLFLDWTLGTDATKDIAGWPLGRIIELYGPESTGKSLICLKTIVEAQKRNLDCVYIDCENTFDSVFAKTLGVNVDKLIISRENRGAHAIDLACKLMEASDKVKVIIFDSLASMIPEVEIEASLEDQQMASMARIMSKGLRKLTLFNKHETLIIFINQLRENPGAGMYANPEYTPGGRAIKFYASVRAEIRRGDYLFDTEDKKKKLGQTVKFKITKNKTDVPFREGYFKFMYTGELDRIDELISLGLLREAISRRGAYFTLAGKTFQGRDQMQNELETNKEFFELARKEIFKDD